MDSPRKCKHSNCKEPARPLRLNCELHGLIAAVYSRDRTNRIMDGELGRYWLIAQCARNLQWRKDCVGVMNLRAASFAWHGMQSPAYEYTGEELFLSSVDGEDDWRKH